MTTSKSSATVDNLSAPRATAWRAVLFLAVTLFAGALMRTVFSPLQEAAKLDIGLSDFGVSLVQGLATGAPIALVSLPLAWIIDHGHRVRLLIALLLVCVIGTIWTGFATSLPTLFVARMLCAVGSTCAVSVIISLVADLCAPDKRGRAIVILALGTYAGAAAAFVLGGALLTTLGAHPIAGLGAMAPWRATHLVLAIAGSVLLAPLVLLREPARHEVEIDNGELRAIISAIWAKRAFLIPLFVGQVGVTMADTAAAVWITPVLIRDFHLQPAAFAGWVGGILFVGGVLGSVLGGIAADLGHKTGKRGGLLWIAVVATILAIPAALFPIMTSIGALQGLFFLLLLSGTITSVVSSTAVAVLLPNEERGATMAAFGVINALVGLSLAPIVVTLASQAMGGEQHLSQALAGTGLVTGVASFLGYLFAMRNAPRSPTQWR